MIDFWKLLTWLGKCRVLPDVESARQSHDITSGKSEELSPCTASTIRLTLVVSLAASLARGREAL